jgi:hypothetical protein
LAGKIEIKDYGSNGVKDTKSYPVVDVQFASDLIDRVFGKRKAGLFGLT